MPLARFVRLYGDWALALGLAVLLEIEVWTIDPSHAPGDVGTDVFLSGERAVAGAAGLVLTLSLAWRRRAPLVVLAVAIAMSVVVNFAFVLDAATTPAVALAVAVYAVGAHAGRVREWIVLAGVAAVLSNQEIAARLVVSEHTAKTHVAHILRKLNLHDRIQDVGLAYESGLVQPGTA